MRGYPAFNFPAFDAAAVALRALGHEVFSPAERDRRSGFDETPYTTKQSAAVAPDTFDLYFAMRDDLNYIINHADAVALLPGWERSSGATLERRVAEATGKAVLYVVDGRLVANDPRPPENILQEANRLIYGDRQSSYGHPIEDFTRTGRMWGAILGTADVPPEKVGLCMVALKISRECNAPKRDNLVDGAGYFGTVALVRERQATA